MGPVSLSLAVASLLVVFLTRNASDRVVAIAAWCLFASLIASLLVHALCKTTGRATPLMLIDGAALYVTGLMAICRFDGPRWLYALCGALALQCLAHLAYVCDLMSGNAYVLALNVLFAVELLTLVAGGRKASTRIAAIGWRTFEGRSDLGSLLALQAK